MSLNKKELNNEIVLCRPAVRKARVIVIRKLIKKMKILKSCKVESAKEKKLKKWERIFKKVQLMKKVKDDDVTKFALRNSNLENYLHGAKVLPKENALACLAKHEAVARKVNSIRERIQNWETDLPIMLDSLGKKKKSANKSVTKKKGTEAVTKRSKEKKPEENLVKDPAEKSEVRQVQTLEKPVMRTSKKSRDSDRPKSGDKDRKECKVKSKKDSPAESSEKLEKVDDPFFIDKKVIQSKLLLEDVSVRKSSKEVEKLKGRNETSVFQKKPFKVKKELVSFKAQKLKPQPVEDQLHPSWAAKKVKLIKPFEGKKIVFSED